MPDEKTITMSVIMPIEDDIKLRVFAARLRVTRSDVVRNAIREYLERYNVDVLPHPEDAEPVPVVEIKS